eukprot:249367_1
MQVCQDAPVTDSTGGLSISPTAIPCDTLILTPQAAHTEGGGHYSRDQSDGHMFVFQPGDEAGQRAGVCGEGEVESDVDLKYAEDDGLAGISPGSLTSSHGESVYKDDLAMAVNVGSMMVDKNDELESAVSSLKQRLKEQDAEFEKERGKMEEHIVRLERTNHNLQNDLITVGGESEKLSDALDRVERAQSEEQERHEEAHEWRVREAEKRASAAAGEAEALGKELRMMERKLKLALLRYLDASFASRLSTSKELTTAEESLKQLRANGREQKEQKVEETVVGRSEEVEEVRRDNQELNERVEQMTISAMNYQVKAIALCFTKKAVL